MLEAGKVRVPDKPTRAPTLMHTRTQAALYLRRVVSMYSGQVAESRQLLFGP